MEEPTLAQCDHCCKRFLYLTGFRRQSTSKDTSSPSYIIEWIYCSEKCRDEHTKQTDSWTPDKQRASLSVFDDKTLDEWKKRHSL